MHNGIRILRHSAAQDLAERPGETREASAVYVLSDNVVQGRPRPWVRASRTEDKPELNMVDACDVQCVCRARRGGHSAEIVLGEERHAVLSVCYVNIKLISSQRLYTAIIGARRGDARQRRGRETCWVHSWRRDGRSR